MLPRRASPYRPRCEDSVPWSFQADSRKNGYVLEQLFSPLIVQTTPEHEELKEICCPKLADRSRRGDEADSGPRGEVRLLTSAATGVITRHHSHHYFGFAETR